MCSSAGTVRASGDEPPAQTFQYKMIRPCEVSARHRRRLPGALAGPRTKIHRQRELAAGRRRDRDGVSRLLELLSGIKGAVPRAPRMLHVP